MRDEIDALVSSSARVTDADVEALPLLQAESHLMEEIMATPVLESVSDVEPPRRGRSRRRIVALAGVAAVAASAVVIIQPGSDDSPAWAAEVLAVAESAPRLLLDGSDWTVDRANEFSVDNGEVTFSNGDDEFTLSWLPDSNYDSLLADRQQSTDLDEEVTVAGHAGILMAYSDQDFTTIWQQDGFVVEARGLSDRDTYDEALSLMHAVDVDTWLSAMPESVVRPENNDAVVAGMIADIPIPDGLDPATLGDGEGVVERYQLGARVTGAVACVWLDQWITATDSGDTASADEAVTAMASSHDWAILTEMDAEGDYSEVVWEYADAIANGGKMADGAELSAEEPVEGDKTSHSYRAGLGCE